MIVFFSLLQLQQAVLQLENRIFEISGLARAAKDTKEADDNMSTSPDDEEEQIKNAWKKIINRLKYVPAKASAKIRSALVDAIAAARKAHNLDVVVQLRNALVEYHPDAAGASKTTALEILAQHGDYDDEDDEDEDDEEEAELQAGDREFAESEETPQSRLCSCLASDAWALLSSLDGLEDTTGGKDWTARKEWISAVKKPKTISQLAALVSAFVHKATLKIEKIETEEMSLNDILEALDKSNTLRKKNSSRGDSDPSEVWANVNFSDDFCLVKLEKYPWWPARKCTPKDENLASKLESVERTLVSLFGESGSLRIVKADAVLPFSETLPEEDMSQYTRDLRIQLDEWMATARRVVRGHAKKKKKPTEKKAPVVNGAVKEEKKSVVKEENKDVIKQENKMVTT